MTEAARSTGSPEVSPPSAVARRARVTRFVKWGVALAALTLVVWAVPIRDRCVPPEGGKALVVTERDAERCTLQRPDGAEVHSRAECDAMKCERGLASTLKDARVGLLVPICLLYLSSFLLWSLRWKTLMGIAKVPIPFRSVVRIVLEAQAGGVLLPGGAGGDALRVASMVERGASLPVVLASVLLDRAIGLSTVALLSAVIALALDPGHVGLLTLIVGAIPFACALGLVVLRIPRLRELRIFREGPIGRAAAPVLAYLGDPGAPKAVVLAAIPSLLSSAINLATLRGILFALRDVHPTEERWVYVGFTMAMLVSVIPALPGGWGTADAAHVFFLGRAGVSAQAALSMSLLFRLFWYLSAAIGAVLYLARGSTGRARNEARTPSPPPEGKPKEVGPPD
jgi:uncharacterized membrane protein YbhN (UPF0104 family)